MLIKEKVIHNGAKGFTLVELMVVIAVVVAIATIAGFSFNTMVARTRADQKANNVFGLILSSRAKAMGQTRTFVVEIYTDRVTVLRELTPGAGYDPITGLNTANFEQINEYEFTPLVLTDFQINNTSSTTSPPHTIIFISNGQAIVDGLYPQDVGSVDIELSNQNSEYHIVLYPYTGRLIIR